MPFFLTDLWPMISIVILIVVIDHLPDLDHSKMEHDTIFREIMETLEQIWASVRTLQETNLTAISMEMMVTDSNLVMMFLRVAIIFSKGSRKHLSRSDSYSR